MKAIPTQKDGVQNGWLLPIWNATADAWRPEQVYLTVIAPGATKGPHLHLRRCGRFLCIKGDVCIVMRVDGEYREQWSGENSGFEIIEVPSGTPALLMNQWRDEPAYVLNMPTPAWTPEDPDEHPVENWKYPL